MKKNTEIPVPILKNCPFCGGIPELVVQNANGENSWRVECFRKKCGAITIGHSAKNAAKRWNRRDASCAPKSGPGPVTLIPVPIGAVIQPWHWWFTPVLSMTEAERAYYHGHPISGKCLELEGQLFEVRIPNDLKAPIPPLPNHEEAWIRYWASKDIDRKTQPKEWTDFARNLERENAGLRISNSQLTRALKISLKQIKGSTALAVGARKIARHAIAHHEMRTENL